MARGRDAGWVHQSWLAVLVIAVSGSSFVFACATPFAAFAVLAAVTLSRSDALRVMIALWLANQVIGYLVLEYPRTLNSGAWGLAIGAAAVLTLLVAQRIASITRPARGLLGAALTFAGAFTVYEAALYVFAVTGLGGTAAFAPPIVGQVLLINVVALAGLLPLHRMALALGVIRRSAAPAPARSVAS